MVAACHILEQLLNAWEFFEVASTSEVVSVSTKCLEDEYKKYRNNCMYISRNLCFSEGWQEHFCSTGKIVGGQHREVSKVSNSMDPKTDVFAGRV